MDADQNLSTYDSSGVLINEVNIGTGNGGGHITIDSASGRLAISGLADVVLIDPATGEVEQLTGSGLAISLEFARSGEFLAITGFDGAVRLWDVVRGESAGLLLDGTGSVDGVSLWYDEATDSLWANTSGKIQQIPLNPERWIERACEVVGRDLTQDEWDRFVPGEGEVQSACS